MLTGQYVVHDNTTWQIARITATSTRGPHGLPTAATEVELRPLAGGPARCLLNPKGTDVHLTAECVECCLPAGFGACFARGTHDGPRPVRKREPLPYVPSVCECQRADCRACGPVRVPVSSRSSRKRLRSW